MPVRRHFIAQLLQGPLGRQNARNRSLGTGGVGLGLGVAAQDFGDPVLFVDWRGSRANRRPERWSRLIGSGNLPGRGCLERPGRRNRRTGKRQWNRSRRHLRRSGVRRRAEQRSGMPPFLKQDRVEDDTGQHDAEQSRCKCPGRMSPDQATQWCQAGRQNPVFTGLAAAITRKDALAIHRCFTQFCAPWRDRAGLRPAARMKDSGEWFRFWLRCSAPG